MNLSEQKPVAIVDDDPVSGEFLAFVVAELGYPVRYFGSAPSLLEERCTQQFHALILDLAMPEVDGIELLYKLAEFQPVEPIIVVSSMQAPVVDAAVTIGVSLGLAIKGSFHKPTSASDIAAIRQILVECETLCRK